MKQYESRIRAIRKYDSEKMTTVTCRISRAKADRFKAACAQLGVTQYAVLKEAIENAIAKAEAGSES